MTHPADLAVDVRGRLTLDGDPVCPICLTPPCDCFTDLGAMPVVLAAPVGGGDRTVRCSWCAALAGDCKSTGGPAECVLDMAKMPCPYCEEDAGWCQLTGGPNPCEGADEHNVALEDLAAAPTVIVPAAGPVAMAGHRRMTDGRR